MKKKTNHIPILLLYTLSFLLCASLYADPVEFKYETSDPSVETVAVAGAFNSWDKNAFLAPEKKGTGRVFRKTLDIIPGLYYYKLVINGSKWMEDPSADKDLRVNDNYGGFNSGVAVGETGKQYGEAVPGKINEKALRFIPEEKKYAEKISSDECYITLRALAGDIESAACVVTPSKTKEFRMLKSGTAMGFDFWSCLVSGMEGKKDVKLHFLLKDRASFHYSAAGLKKSTGEIKPFLLGMKDEPFVPEWTRGVVWYQIMVDRFRNGNPDNDPGIARAVSVAGDFNGWAGSESGAFAPEKYPLEKMPDGSYRYAVSSLPDGIREYKFIINGEWEGGANRKAEIKNGKTKDGKTHIIFDAGLNRTAPFTSAWHKPLPWEKETAEKEGNTFLFSRFYGGDFQGLIEKVDYLAGLGIGALYLCPVFEARSYSKYDASDYRHIDDNFGFAGDLEALEETEEPSTWKWTKTDSLFLEFIKKCHEKNIKVVIDGVFNHTGTDFWAFRDVKDKLNESKYAGWYDIISFSPFKYKGWSGFASLPEFREDENGLVKGVRDHVFNVAKRWLDPDNNPETDDGIDGFRLDVANEVGIAFWRDFRKHVRSIKKDAVIIGEIWDEDASFWLSGDSFDSVMNYPFTRRAVRYFIDKKYNEDDLMREFSELSSRHYFQVNQAMMNLMDSHDSDRILSQIMNPGRDFDNKNSPSSNPGYNTGPPTDEALKIMKLLAIFQLTYPGAPMIYYGGEAGIWGEDDPACRKPMIWEELMPYEEKEYGFRKELFSLYNRLISARNAMQALKKGEVRFLPSSGRDLLFYERNYGEETVVMAINRGTAERTLDPAGIFRDSADYYDLLERTDFTAEGAGSARKISAEKKPERYNRKDSGIKIAPQSARIFVKL